MKKHCVTIRQPRQEEPETGENENVKQGGEREALYTNYIQSTLHTNYMQRILRANYMQYMQYFILIVTVYYTKIINICTTSEVRQTETLERHHQLNFTNRKKNFFLKI